MSKSLLWMLAGGSALALVASASGQMKQKPGLWEVTSTMSMAGMPQMPAMPQIPAGVHVPAMASPFAPHTTQICVTQAMIDKYGAPYSTPQHGDCKVTDMVTKPDGMTAKITCTGQMDATGTVESSWTDANTTHTLMHLKGSMNTGSGDSPIEMTMKADSTYKGPDCGNVKPMEMPADQ